VLDLSGAAIIFKPTSIVIGLDVLMATKRRRDDDQRRNADDWSLKSVLLVLLLLILCCGLILFLLAPPRLILSAPSPDQTMKLELWTQGFMGPTWADLIWTHEWKKENVYREGGDEVQWSKDTEVVWSKDSQRFFVASAQMIGVVSPRFRDNQYLYLTTKSDYEEDWQRQYPAVVLTYNISNKELRHNLYRGLRPFDRRDLKGIDWMQKLPE
jgi:hypothetical protein